MTNFDIVSFLEKSVQIPSHDDVDEMRTFLVDTLTSHGFEPLVDSAGNTITTRGSGAPHVVLNTHIDTVPPHLPFHSDSEMGQGRGACDAKGPLSAFVYAFIHSNPSGKLTLAITPDEELTSRGANALHFDDVPDAFIVGEPTNLDICNASKGRFEAKIVITGENAHAAESHLTNNVIDVCVSILAALKKVPYIAESFDDGANFASKRMSVSKSEWLSKGRLLKMLKQKSISDFFQQY